MLNLDKRKYIAENIPAEDYILVDDSEVDALYEYLNNKKNVIEYSNSKDFQFLRLAREISTWSKDPSSQLGAVAISEDNFIVLAQGYNGFPRGIEDNHRLYIRALKYPIVVHAEMNMIFNAARNGTSLENSSVYIYGLPCCHECAKGLVQSSVKRVIMCDVKKDQRWIDSFAITSKMFDEAGIKYSFIDKEYLD